MERTVRNFRLLEQIGTGGMGVIYRAVQLTLDRQVALKEMHPHLAKDEEFLRRFEREAKTAATLQHENIVGVIDFGQEGGSFFLALEFVDGADLKTLLAKDPKVVLPVALAVMNDVLKGLEHAHARGIVHRDIKPANVMVTKEGIAKIADFSIAQAQAMPSMTVTGAMLGTPAYMSPEQAAGGRPVDTRTDLFSAGVILYEMLGGKRPFDGDTYAAIISQLLTVSPPELHAIDPVVPESVTRVVKRALEKDPDKRYQTAADFRRDLENAARDEKIPLDRALVVEWQKSPREFQDALKRRQARELFQRGLYLKNQGLTHLDEAIKALITAAALDPTNDEAKKHLDELQKTKQDSVIVQRKSVLRQQQQRTWAIGIGAGAILVGVLAAGFHFLLGTPAATPLPVATPSAVVAVSPPPSPAAVTSATTAPTATATPTAVAAAKTPKPKASAIAKATTAGPASTPTQVAIAATPPSTPVPATTTASPGAATDQISMVDPEMTREGFLKLIVKPWAKVYVDGNFVGDTPFAKPLKISKGTHTLRLENPNFPAVESKVEIPAGKMLTRTVQLQEP